MVVEGRCRYWAVGVVADGGTSELIGRSCWADWLYAIEEERRSEMGMRSCQVSKVSLSWSLFGGGGK